MEDMGMQLSLELARLNLGILTDDRNQSTLSRNAPTTRSYRKAPVALQAIFESFIALYCILHYLKQLTPLFDLPFFFI
jgi:hypothetical protein